MNITNTTVRPATSKDLQEIILDDLLETQCAFDELRYELGKKKCKSNMDNIKFINSKFDLIRELVEVIVQPPIKVDHLILKDAVDAQESAQALANIFTSIADETCKLSDMRKKIAANLEVFALSLTDLGLLDEVQK
ncbi:MAG: hypothetical protein R8M45_00310 [Ghiorsea sp.]